MRALETFYAQGRMYSAGDEVEDDNPIVKGREHLFGPVDEQAASERPTEAKTARKPAQRKRPAAKKAAGQ